MDWSGEGFVLGLRPHGETSGILEVMTPDQGRHAGLVRGAFGRKLSPVLMTGNQVLVHWRARAAEQLGTFTVEPLRARAAGLLGDRLALAALSSITSLISRALPEREPHPALYAATVTLIDSLATLPDWPILYLHWEKGLLGDLGFGLDLSACAVTGAREGLVYVSPRSGRAVTALGASGYEDRLLALPPALLTLKPAPQDQILAGLTLTGHFLNKGLSQGPDTRPLPEARSRLLDLLSRT